MRTGTCPRAFALALPLAFACAVFSSVARADGPTSNQLFEEATALIEQQRYADAIPKLEEAQRLDPGVGTQFNLAVCYAMTGRLAVAYRNFSQVESLARASGKKEREQEAHAELASLRPRVSFAAIRVDEPGPVVVRVDGEVVSNAELGFVPLDRGEHRIEAIASSKKPFEAHVMVAGEAERHDVMVPELESIEAPRPIDDPVAPPVETRSSPRRTAAYVAGGIGLVGLGVATVSGIIILSDKTVANDHCDHFCDSEGEGAAHEGRNAFPINWVGWGVAAAGLGTATYLWLTSPSEPSQRPATGTTILPAFDGRTAGAFITRSF